MSREGVQRDLLPLIEGTTVSTKYGPVKTDHVLFIASGAFHLAKPSDLLPELQGRLPIRVELSGLSRDDLRRILTEPEHSLIKQYGALMATEGVTLTFTDDAVDALADLAADINDRIENIGARRLHTVLERLLEEISFTATDRAGETIVGRCGLREREGRAAGPEGRPEPVHFVAQPHRHCEARRAEAIPCPWRLGCRYGSRAIRRGAARHPKATPNNCRASQHTGRAQLVMAGEGPPSTTCVGACGKSWMPTFVGMTGNGSACVQSICSLLGIA